MFCFFNVVVVVIVIVVVIVVVVVAVVGIVVVVVVGIMVALFIIEVVVVEEKCERPWEEVCNQCEPLAEGESGGMEGRGSGGEGL